jgi:hypothetical protein
MKIKIIFVFIFLISCGFSFAQYAELERFDNIESFILNKIIFADIINEDKKILAANRILEIRILDASESNETIFLNKDYTADSIITNKSGTREETHFTRDSTGIKKIMKKIFVYMTNSATQQSYKAFFQNANAEFFNSPSSDTIFYSDKGIVGDSSVYIFTKDKNGNPLQLVKSSADEEDKIFYGYKNGKLVSRSEGKKKFEFITSDTLITNYSAGSESRFYLKNKRISKIEYFSPAKELAETVSFRYEPNGLIESAEVFTYKDGNSKRTKLFYDYSYYED